MRLNYQQLCADLRRTIQLCLNAYVTRVHNASWVISIIKTRKRNNNNKLPKFVHRKYASLVNIHVGTLLRIAQQNTTKTTKKIFKKLFFFIPTFTI